MDIVTLRCLDDQTDHRCRGADPVRGRALLLGDPDAEPSPVIAQATVCVRETALRGVDTPLRRLVNMARGRRWHIGSLTSAYKRQSSVRARQQGGRRAWHPIIAVNRKADRNLILGGHPRGSPLAGVPAARIPAVQQASVPQEGGGRVSRRGTTTSRFRVRLNTRARVFSSNRHC